MIIINMSEKNTGIWRYISNIDVPIISLAVKQGSYGGYVFEKRIKHIPFTVSLKYPGFVFKHSTFGSLKSFVEKHVSNKIYASQGVPVFTKSNNFAIIYDILTLKYHKSQRYRKYIRNNLEKMKDFKGIVTVSNHTKNELINLGFDKNKIDVIYPYISNNIKLIDKSKEELRKELNLPLDKKIIINVSGNTPNKNNDLLPSIAKLSDNYLLIHVGPKVSDNILNFENVDDSLLSVLYQASDVYLSTSLDEGFGIPPIEAQRFGLPVVARKLDIYNETMGKSYVNVIDFFKNINDWRNAIEYAIYHVDEYREKSIENAKKYSEEIFKENWKKQIKKWEGLV